MKIIASRGLGKITFLIGFLDYLVNNRIVKKDDTYIFCPTFCDQVTWRDSRFSDRERNKKYLTKEYKKNKLLVFDDMQDNKKQKWKFNNRTVY